MSEVVTYNKKPHWVLIRGLIRESAHWGSFPERLTAAFPGCRVSAIDLPGNGKLCIERSPWSLDGFVEHLHRELQKVRAANHDDTHEVYAIAISLGGMITALWANRYPDDVKGAVLINTSLRGASPFYSRISLLAYPTLVKILLAREPKQREDLILDLTTKAVREPNLLRDRVAIQSRHPLRRMNALRQLWAAAFHPRIDKPAIPILLLNSLGDQLVHPDCSAAIQKRWIVPMKRHAWAGHDLPVDDPQWTIEAVRGWFESLSRDTINGSVSAAPDA